MKKLYAFIIITGFFSFSFQQPESAQKKSINWLSVEEAFEKMKSEPRPVLIDLYTNWCYWCKVMDKETYSNKKVADYINNHFYPIKINAETRNTINWNNINFKYDSLNKVNEFAIYITNGQLAFPNTVIFPDIKGVPASIPGYLKKKDAEVILTYFAEGAYKKENFNNYASGYKVKW